MAERSRICSVRLQKLKFVLEIEDIRVTFKSDEAGKCFKEHTVN